MGILVTACCQEHVILCSIQLGDPSVSFCEPDSSISLCDFPSHRSWQTPGVIVREINDDSGREEGVCLPWLGSAYQTLPTSTAAMCDVLHNSFQFVLGG
jgi:hypothetical protein